MVYTFVSQFHQHGSVLVARQAQRFGLLIVIKVWQESSVILYRNNNHTRYWFVRFLQL